MEHPSTSYLGRLLLRRPLSAHLTDTSVTICPPGRAGVPALPLIGAKTATGRLACSKKTSLQIQVKRNGFLSGFRTCCLGMACLFGLLNGILSVSLEPLVAGLGHVLVEDVILTDRRSPGTCVLAIVSLVDVGDIPSKPDISGEGTVGVIATWEAVSEYAQLLFEACVIRLGMLGWTGYGKQALFFSNGFSGLGPLNIAE